MKILKKKRVKLITRIKERKDDWNDKNQLLEDSWTKRTMVSESKKKKKETGKITRREENGKADRKEKSIRMIWEREMRKAWLKEMQSCTNFEIQFNNLTVNDTIVLKIELIFVWKIGNHWKSLGQSIVAV